MPFTPNSTRTVGTPVIGDLIIGHFQNLLTQRCLIDSQKIGVGRNLAADGEEPQFP